MFQNSNKKTQTQPQWTLQVLTQDYLIEGLATFNSPYGSPSEILDGWLNRLGQQITTSHVGLDFSLTSAQWQPTGQLIQPQYNAFAELVIDLRNVIALIPRNEESLHGLQKKFQAYQFPFPTNFVAGPYFIHANLLANSQSGKWDTTTFLPLAEVQISSQLAEAKLTNFQAPWLLLNAMSVQAGGR